MARAPRASVWLPVSAVVLVLAVHAGAQQSWLAYENDCAETPEDGYEETVALEDIRAATEVKPVPMTDVMLQFGITEKPQLPPQLNTVCFVRA